MLATRHLFNNIKKEAAISSLRHKPLWLRVKEGESVDPKLVAKFRERIENDTSHLRNPTYRGIQYGSYLLCGGLALYFVIFLDYGYDDHCFTPIRKWFHRKTSDFWTLSDKEISELKDIGRS